MLSLDSMAASTDSLGSAMKGARRLLGRLALHPLRSAAASRISVSSIWQHTQLKQQQQRWRPRRAFGSARVACSAAPTGVTTTPETPPSTPADSESSGQFKSTAYPFTDIEAKWQAYWEANKTFRTPDIHELDTSKPKFYALDMFPYPR